jgi:ElaA protein
MTPRFIGEHFLMKVLQSMLRYLQVKTRNDMKIIAKRYEELTLDELYAILKIRVDVFVVEQQCPYPEIDGKDEQAWHVMLMEENAIVAYLRVLEAGVSFQHVSIGRVLSIKRRLGHGRIILKEGIRIAFEELKADAIWIEAQSYAKDFYANEGFRQTSEEFLEDGIPHIRMVLDLAKRNEGDKQ